VRNPHPESPIPNPLYACLYRPPALDNRCTAEQPALQKLAAIAQEFSPRYERHRDDLVSIDVSGLERLLGPPRAIGDELRHTAAARGVRIHVAVAGTRIAAIILAHARPGVTIVDPGGEAEALAPLHIGVLGHVGDLRRSVLDTREDSACGSSERERASEASGGARLRQGDGGPAVARGSDEASGGWRAPRALNNRPSASARGDEAPRGVKKLDESLESALSTFTVWGLKTLGELAALPPGDLASRLGRQGLVWQAIARGDDVRPLVPTLEEERFESSLELEWPIEGLEPLSFVLTRLLEPLSTRLERRDRGAAVLHVILRLVTRETHTSRLELPTPMRDVRALRTLALLDLESHPPAAAIDRVTVVIDPTPGRVLQHTLFTRAQPTPEQLSTLLARLGALMGQDRLGAPVSVDSYRPGAFAMAPFKTEHDHNRAQVPAISHQPSAMASALRRCRQPVPARVAIENGRPARVTTDRRGFVGGSVVRCAGPWRTSGDWWVGGPEMAGGAGTAGKAGGALPPILPIQPVLPSWNRDEWDVVLSDGAVYRIFQDRDTDSWYIDAIVD
jgi:protein ImuB